jgi:predicted PurR-regulated permease PerM
MTSTPGDEHGYGEKVFRFTATVVLVIAVVFVLKTLRGIFVPVMFAVFFAYLFAPAVEAFARIRVPRIATLFILLALFITAGFFLTRLVARDIREFLAVWPSYESKLLNWIGAFIKEYLNLEPGAILRILQSQRLSRVLSSLLTVSLNFFGKFSLTLLILIFFYLSYANYPKIIRKAFDEERAEHILGILNNINEQIIRYVMIKTFISAGTGVFTGVACRLFGMQFSVLFGFIAFTLNYIPYVGSFIAVALPVLFSLFVFQGTVIPLFVFAALFVIQLVWGSFLDPEIMSTRFNLSPIIIIISLVFWSYVWGAAGAFLAVPTTAIIRIILQNIRSLSFAATLMSKKAD